MRYRFILPVFISIAACITACEKLQPRVPPDDSILDGPLTGLSHDQHVQFLRGDVAFNDDLFTAATGLGPVFVAPSCGSCHAGDGKGHPFSTLTRFGQKDSTGNAFLHMGGPQLQNRAIPGFLPESLPVGAPYSRFMPPANTGLGFLELVSDADILAIADPNDVNGDGISGVPNYLELQAFLEPRANAMPRNNKYIHRFGKKASAYNLLHQTVNAYNQDMGITTTFSPKDPYSGLTSDPEISDQTVRDVVFYLQTLKAPIQRNQQDPLVTHGKSLFLSVGCESCHKQTLKTGYSPVSALSYKEFHPFTDLLLHDMGAGLDDGYTEGTALTSEWRTPPLWGLGLAPNSQGGRYFLLHDGRAGSIDEAILLHGGEAKKSRDNYQSLSSSDKAAILKFLESL